MQPRYICLYLQVHLIAMNSKCQSLRPTPTLPTPTPQCSSSDVMWRSRPLRRCFALVPLCLWSLDNLSLRRDEVFLAFFHVFVSTKMCYFQKGSLFFWLPNRLSTTYLMLSGASAGIESIVAAGCWNWNTDCQRYIFVMNNYFERGEFEFFFLLSKVENGQFILVKIGNLHVMRKI